MIIISKFIQLFIEYRSQRERWEHYDEHPFLSPEFKQDGKSNEIYTPSFEHRPGYNIRDD